MAYVNVKDWSVDQVTDWLKGLDNVILPYTKSFLNNEVKGQQLLNLRSDDLEHLGVFTLGHQEIILEAVEHLRNFHYELDKENLQMLALRLSCAANSLYKELLLADDNCTMVPTQTMSNVHNIIATIKPLVCWLDRSPFRGDKDYMDTKIQLLQLSFEMATSAHRDIFSEKPVRTIRDIGETLARLADHIIQEITDPMILQPASLDLATLKKKEQELGFSLLPSNHAIHQIAEIKYGSPAHNSTKIEEGDEIVQVNYQTVVGWQRKKVVLLLQDAPPEIVLTLKKRPRHTKVYGQIYMKPYRLPSRKRASPYSRWNDDLPSPQLLAMPDMPQICYKPKPVIVAPEIETSSSDSEPPDSPLDVGGRVYPLKPQPVLQRRNTITGASPTSKRPHQAIEQYWQLLKNQAASKHASSYNIQTDKFPEESMVLRDKSVSCGHGLELVPRPSTVIGITQTRNFDFQNKSKKKVNFEEKVLKPEPDLNEEKSVSVNSLTSLHLTNETINFIDEGEDLMDRSNMSIHWQQEIIEEIIDNIRPKKDVAVLSEVDVQGIIKKFDANAPKLFQKNSSTDFKKPVVPPRTITKLRGKLDKSHSTPAYDTTPENDFETEPVQFELGIPIVETSNLAVNLNLSKHQEIDVPPKPPPRSVPDSPKPRYPFDSPKPVEYTKRIPSITETELPKGTARNVEMSFESPKMKSFEPKCTSTPEVEPPLIKITPSDGPTTKVSPTNSVVRAVIYSSRTKTGKKKSSLIAKRRKVGVKDVTPGELQGYLYLRLRSKRDQMVHWEKRWVVLTGSCLYGFKTKEASKADSFIYLAGFTVSLATEVKSRANAFKVYHTGTVFYFSAEDFESLNSWMEMITAATLHCDTSKGSDSILYSETDDSDSEMQKNSSVDKGMESIKKFGSLKKFTSKKSGESNQSGSTSLDRKWFFNKPNSGSKNYLPVPTAQFRSYRKIPSSGINMESVSTGNFTSHIPNFASRLEIQTISQSQNISVPNLTVDSLKPQEFEKPTVTPSKKPKPLNYMHASNPSLCDFTDFHGMGNFPKMRPFQHCNETLIGFVTLEELMNKQTEEQKLNPYLKDEEVPINPNLIRPDVVYGEVPIRPSESHQKTKHSRTHSETSESACSGRRKSSTVSEDIRTERLQEATSSCFGRRSSSFKNQKGDAYGGATGTYPKPPRLADDNRNRSLPRRTKDTKTEPCKVQSYETVYSPPMTNYVQYAQNRTLEGKSSLKKSQKLERKFSFNSKEPKVFNAGECTEKFWLDSLRRNDKVSPPKQKMKLKPAVQYTPMSLPLASEGKLNPKFAFELNLDEKSGRTGKFKNLFGKPNENRKEKTFLGSPKLHRAIFRKHSAANSELDFDASPQVQSTRGVSDSDLSQEVSNQVLSCSPPLSADYPGLEYPPVFEPETYSLADPQSSLTLLRKQSKNN